MKKIKDAFRATVTAVWFIVGSTVCIAAIIAHIITSLIFAAAPIVLAIWLYMEFVR
jgi:hypothetical protein